MSTRINPSGIQFPTIGGGVGVLPTKPIARISHALFEHAVRSLTIHDDQIRIGGITHDGAIGFDRHGLGIFKQVDAYVRDLEVSQAANGFHGALEH